MSSIAALEAQNHSKVTIVSLSVEDYRIYLETNPPLDAISQHEGTVFCLAERDDTERIKHMGLNILEHEILRIPKMDSPVSLIEGDINGRYHNYVETEAMILDLGERFPQISNVFSIGQTIEGREIYVIKISDHVANEEDEPNVYFVGLHHAREWISLEVPLLFAEYILENYENDAEIKRLVDEAQIYVLPLLNPDGLEFSIHVFRWWRKNRRYNGDFSWGVDPNRNYAFMWGLDDIGSSPDPNHDAYRGAGPFSEPETLALSQLMLSHPPAGALTYHSFSHVIIYPWGYTTDPAPDEDEMETVAKEMSDRIFAVHGRRYEYGKSDSMLYPTNGDMDDWVYGIFGALSFCVELSGPSYEEGGFFTSDKEIDLCFEENLPSMLYFIDYFIKKYE
jgi:hypothetical protein